MRRTVVCFLLISFLLALGGCACEHAWEPASCQAPATCMLCGETQGELAAHTWAEATCIAPRTCTVCGVTEGVPSTAHIYEGGSCALCGAAKPVTPPFDANTTVLAAIEAFNAGENALSDAYDGEASALKRAECETWFAEVFEVEAQLSFMATYGMDDLFVWIFEREEDAARIAAVFAEDGAPIYRRRTVLIYGDEKDVQAFTPYLAS